MRSYELDPVFFIAALRANNRCFDDFSPHLLLFAVFVFSGPSVVALTVEVNICGVAERSNVARKPPLLPKSSAVACGVVLSCKRMRSRFCSP